MEKVSIVIPVYNAEDKIIRCVESLLYGLYSNIEIILIDDCSKDSSWEICQNLETKYDRVVSLKNSKNRGVSYTRNKGIEYATGKYIMFVDSDDWVSCKYVDSFVTLLSKYEESFVISGFYYFNLKTYSKDKYIWENSDNNVSIVLNPNLFELKNKMLLNALWNKIFVRDIIVNNNVKFDEHQSIGEDLKFILDYIAISKIHSYVFVNEPLYYYTYSDHESLLSNYGWNDINFSISNSKRIGEICKDLYCIENVKDIVNKDINGLKSNYFYHILNNKKHSFNEKKIRIRELSITNEDKKLLKNQLNIHFKNKLISILMNVKRILTRIKSEIIQSYTKIKIYNNVKKFDNKDISIISQNCIGGVLYHDLNLKFLSPTINLYFTSMDYLKFISNLKFYLSNEIIIKWDEQYPIGILNDIVVHFMHYNTCTEAYESWKNRKERINYDKIFVINTDMEGFGADCWEKWKKIEYPKILLTANKKFVDKDSIYFKNYEKQSIVGNLIPKREFYKNGKLIKKLNNLK